jgi:hypothetical protein
MKNIVIALALTGALLWSAPARANDKAAHLGVSYALTTLGYGLFKTAGMPQTPAAIFSAVFVSFGGILKEGWVDTNSDEADMYYNTAGSVLAIGTIFVFDF